jgi:drug/metabolite transporter (DMT)-like permease
MKYVYVQLLLVGLIWGGTFVAGRIVAVSVGAYSAALLRFVVATFCSMLLIYKLEGKLPKLKFSQFIWIFLLGLSGIFVYNVCFFQGLQTIPASRAALIVALNPIVIAIASSLIFKERLTLLKSIGIIFSLVGAAIVIGKGNPLDLLAGGIQAGDLYIFGCVISWSTYTLIGKQVMSQLSPLVVTNYACAVGTLCLLPPAVKNGLIQDLQQLSLVAGLGIVYLGLFGSAVAFSWYYAGVQAIGASGASIFINFVPVSAVILAALLLKEPITLSLLLGGGLVIFGVLLTNQSSRLSNLALIFRRYLKDLKENIINHRARSTIATQLSTSKDPMTLFELRQWLGYKDPMTLFELKEWLGYFEVNSTINYTKITPTKLAKSYQNTKYFKRNLWTVEVVIDCHAITTGTATNGKPWKYYDLGHGLCTYNFFFQCQHKIVCAGCGFYISKGSTKAQIIEAKGKSERMLQKISLTEDEQLAVKGGIEALALLKVKLADTPTPSGQTPRQLEKERQSEN